MVEGDAETAAFELLADEKRLAIVRELADRWLSAPDSDPVGFSKLRKAVDVDDAGKFNYHLDRLCGHFVRKVDDGYRPTVAGIEIVGGILAGTYSDGSEERTAETDQECPQTDCDAPLIASHEEGYMQMECPDHGIVYGNTLPSGAAEGRPMESVVSLATMKGKHDLERACEGACPHCWGDVSITLPVEDPPGDDDGSEQTLVGFECDRCGLGMRIPPGACLLSHPAVVSFYHDHGIDVRSAPYADLAIVSPVDAEMRSESPTEIEVTTTIDGERLRVVVDEHVDIVETERTRVSDPQESEATGAKEV